MEKINPSTDQELLDRYLKGEVSDQERMRVEAWYLELTRSNPSQIPLGMAIAQEQIRKRIHGGGLGSWVYYAAASIIVVMGLGLALLYSPSLKNTERSAADGLPAGFRAKLTVNGRELDLSGASAAELKLSGAGQVSSNASGELVYNKAASQNGEQANRIELSVPRGGQYKIELPDGSKVWLNANSKLVYPDHFSGVERRVELKGEAFFEVQKDANHPFRVQCYSIDIKVLGTRFNVKSLETRNITTLVEGSVAVNVRATGEAQRLVPGQQSEFTSGVLKIREVNTYDDTAWVSGVFVFRKKPIREVADDLAEWYDLDPSVGLPAGVEINAEIPRNKPLQEVLKALSQTSKLNLVYKERRITIE